MKRWPTKRLGNLVNFLGGGTPRRDRADYWGGNIPWASVKDLQSQSLETTAENITDEGLKNSATNLIPKGTVIIASRVGLGKVAINQKPVAINQDLKALTPRSNDLLPRYLLHFLFSKADYFERAGVGATVKGLTIADYQKLNIAVPPLSEQARIVSLLDEADELRKLRAQADRCTAELFPALFAEMFGKSNNSWRRLTFGELVQDFHYGTSNKSTGEGRPTLRIPNVVEQAVNLDDLKFVPVSDVDFERLRLIDGDLLFVRTNGNADYVGRCAVFDINTIKAAGYAGDEFIYASYLIRARLQTEKVSPIFVQNFLTSFEGLSALRARSKTSAGQFNINTEGLGSIPIPVPPLPLQKEFAQRVTEIRELEAGQAASRHRLEELFQSLLHRAFNGNL
jgi:type I restriction enzyme S subunit